MFSHFIILLFLSACVTSTAALPSLTSTLKLLDAKEIYSSKPSETMPIQPILIYPSPKEMPYQGRALLKDHKIIYIKLLKRKSYRPKKAPNKIDAKHYPKEIQMKDILYVKTLANGQFSHKRLKLYRLPEFYAITVYKKGQLKK